MDSYIRINSGLPLCGIYSNILMEDNVSLCEYICDNQRNTKVMGTNEKNDLKNVSSFICGDGAEIIPIAKGTFVVNRFGYFLYDSSSNMEVLYISIQNDLKFKKLKNNVLKIDINMANKIYRSFVLRLPSTINSEIYNIVEDLYNNYKYVSNNEAILQKPLDSCAGILSIEGSHIQRYCQSNAHLDNAFTNLTSLIDHANDVLSLIKRIAARYHINNLDEVEQFRSTLMKLGFRSRNHHQSSFCDAIDLKNLSLSDNIIELLISYIQENGEIVTLVDAYCVVNRLLVDQMVSPGDFLRICHRNFTVHSKLHLMIRKEKFYFLRTKPLNFFLEKINHIVQTDGYITSYSLCESSGLSLLISKEILLYFEDNGYLCRDQTIQNVCFYNNLFID